MRRTGQATVELSLGAMVLITVILFGVHFAEVGYLSLKVQEAATYATWEATGRRVQDLAAGNDAPFDRIVNGGDAVDLKAEVAYEDFNGLSSVNNGNAVVLKGLTRGSALTVRCSDDPALTFEPTPTTRGASVYFDKGGLSCSAEARLEAVRIATGLLNGGDGFFKAKQYDARGAAAGGTMKICSMGRATSGVCQGRLSILLNDWGLSGDAERGECRLQVGNNGPCVSNTPASPPRPPPPPNYVYKNAVQRMWAPGFPMAVAFATTFAGGAPVNPNEYWFSYAGYDAQDGYASSSYMQNISGEGLNIWNTGGPGVPGSTVPRAAVQRNCFMGMPGRPGQGCP